MIDRRRFIPYWVALAVAGIAVAFVVFMELLS